MLFDALVVGLLIGWWRGGSLARLVSHGFRGLWLIILAVTMQLAIPRMEVAGWIGRGGSFWVLLASYGLIVLMVVLNANSITMLLAGVGVAMNIAVIALNGAMPVSVAMVRRFTPQDLGYVLRREGYRHLAMTTSTRLPWLGDVLPFPLLLPAPKIVILSAGDILLSVGLLLFIQQAMQYPAVPSDFAVGCPPEEAHIRTGSSQH